MARLELAIGRLGAQGLRAVLVEQGLRPLLETRQSRRLEEAFRRPWPHALAVGLLAQRIVNARARDGRGGEAAAQAYLAGLFADAGRPVAGLALLDLERPLLAAGLRRGLGEEDWLAAVEVVHRPIGAALARRFGLPVVVADAVAASGRYDAAAGASLGNVVRLATALAALEGFFLRPDDPGRAPALVAEGRAAIGLDEAAVARVRHGLKELVARR
jgi:HD-like signal output (HDOD) protein